MKEFLPFSWRRKIVRFFGGSLPRPREKVDYVAKVPPFSTMPPDERDIAAELRFQLYDDRQQRDFQDFLHNAGLQRYQAVRIIDVLVDVEFAFRQANETLTVGEARNMPDNELEAFLARLGVERRFQDQAVRTIKNLLRAQENQAKGD
ncbi:MAG: hypothetical protein HZB10_00760 [Candidatus Yonathbacteria bacterium]|nr:hypothetical protein [Candidatus Yonathbacteria bacterium]